MAGVIRCHAYVFDELIMMTLAVLRMYGYTCSRKENHD